MHRTGFIAATFSDALSLVRGMARAESFSAQGVVVRSTAVCCVILCGVGAGYAQSALPTSTAAGVFTEEQAKRGAAAYSASCAICHGAELRSADREVPFLTDKAFKFAWIGKTIAEKFETVRDTMPLREEHSLPDQVYLDIVTYILRFNKIPAGDKPLELNEEALKRIVIAEPSGN
jgi:quinoprotein glucose dehydrogenase